MVADLTVVKDSSLGKSSPLFASDTVSTSFHMWSSCISVYTAIKSPDVSAKELAVVQVVDTSHSRVITRLIMPQAAK